MLASPSPTCCSKLYTTDDWWSVWLGIIFATISITLTYIGYDGFPKFLIWNNNPIHAFYSHKLWMLIPLWFLMNLTVTIGLYVMKKPIKMFMMCSFNIAFVLAIIASILSMQEKMKGIGMGTSVWAIIIGVLISNIFWHSSHPDHQKLPTWLTGFEDGALDEFFIKVNVTLLAINISSVIHLGLKGLLVAWIDTPLLIIFMLILGKYIFGIDFKQNLTLAVATCVCGTSAAVAVAAVFAWNKDSYKTPVAIMSIFTAPLIPILPMIAKHVFKFSDSISGALIGGSIDTTGAVIASATILGHDALKTAAIVKMLQNTIIGPICVVLSIISIYKEKNIESNKNEIMFTAPLLSTKINDDDPSASSSSYQNENNNDETQPGSTTTTVMQATPITTRKTNSSSFLLLLWDRFPKFVLGFMITSMAVSWFVPLHKVDQAIEWCLFLGEWFGAVGFVFLGLNIRLRQLAGNVHGLSLIVLYIIGQTLDCIVTGLIAWLAFKN